jgi:hypothetical protein
MANSGHTITLDATGKIRSIEADDTRERLNRLAWLLDSSIPIPGTRLTIGADALIGLIPLVGDLIGVLLSSYIVGEAARLGAPRIVLAGWSSTSGSRGSSASFRSRVTCSMLRGRQTSAMCVC